MGLITWLMNRRKITLNEAEAISTIHTIQLYTHIRNIPFQSFMKWAFGESWTDVLIIDLYARWNERHSQLALIKHPKDMSAIIYPMIDWYVQINKPQE